jgi:hypothetical protein
MVRVMVSYISIEKKIEKQTSPKGNVIVLGSGT